jgi:hypothetical protein
MPSGANSGAIERGQTFAGSLEGRSAQGSNTAVAAEMAGSVFEVGSKAES